MMRHSAVLCVVVLAYLGALASSCTKLEPPTIKPEAAKVQSVTPAGLTVRITLAVHNPNSFALTGRSVNAKVTLAERVKLGPVSIDQKIKLPAEETTKVSVDVKTSWANAAQLATLAAGQATIPYVVDGKMVVGGKRLNAEVPFEIAGKLSRAEIVKAGLKGLPALPALPGLGR